MFVALSLICSLTDMILMRPEVSEMNVTGTNDVCYILCSIILSENHV